MKCLTLLLVIPAVFAGVVYQVPDPYRWDESFTVQSPRIDDEHRGLFNGILRIERENTQEALDDALIKYRDHFIYEEGQFEQTMSDDYVEAHKQSHDNFLTRAEDWTVPVPDSELSWAKNWLVQHIKNTDFKYIGLMPHPLPRPYMWDESFELFYKQLDDEHKGLFDALRAVEHNPTGNNELSDLKFKMRAHFDNEQGYFCKSDTYQECETHKDKHDRFYKALYSLTIPVSMSKIFWAQNWLVQHIKNTDFLYKHKLNTYKHDVPLPYIWDESFQVYYKMIDDQHVHLFEAIRESTEDPTDAAKYEHLKKIMKEHFDDEEAEFKKIPNFEEYVNDHIGKHADFMNQLNSHSVPLDCDFVEFTKSWLAQHIKNTDFAYRGKMIHDVVEPYVWEESFLVFYKQLDDEHKGLFDCIRECSEDPANKEKYDTCQDLLRRHFDYEESEFCKVEGYDCHGHYLKHFNFQTRFQGAGVPLDADTLDFAKNWLVQHIKNTDHAYRGKMLMRRHYIVPEPYVWDKTFTVDIQQMDDEHVGLFDVIRKAEANSGDQASWDELMDLFKKHFDNEEDLFTQIHDNKHDIADHKNRHEGLMKTIKGATVPISQEMLDFIKNWLAQHIKNTDFDYRGKMPKVHQIPEPYEWDSTFAVEYKQMDDEHKVLFSCLKDIEDDPSNKDLVDSCLKSYTDHFEEEQDLFTKSGTYPDEEAYQHINKHDAFLVTMKDLSTPVPSTWIDYAKNWLTQHIKNTDFRYKDKMPFEVSDPYVWDESFEVFYKRLDDEHVVLFDALQELGEKPDDIDVLNKNRDVFRDHFDYEEKQFMECGVACHADAHKKKHDIFFKTLTWVTTPVSKEYLDFAKNWLSQHIKNTDFLYKYKLPTKHTVPKPYIWNKEFEVFYKQLDDEHKGLFASLKNVEDTPNSRRKLKELKTLMRNHFIYEEGEICKSENIDFEYCQDHKKKHVLFSEKLAKFEVPVEEKDIAWAQNWLVQHIKNTDFGYKGKLTHPVPEPYVWDRTFAVDYDDLDSQHEAIFAAVYAVSEDPNNQGKIDELKKLLHDHFVYEEAKFCAVKGFNCVDHKMKHYKFWTRFEGLKAPVNCDIITWTKNWFTQHVKNTDHQYKERL